MVTDYFPGLPSTDLISTVLWGERRSTASVFIPVQIIWSCDLFDRPVSRSVDALPVPLCRRSAGDYNLDLLLLLAPNFSIFYWIQ